MFIAPLLYPCLGIVALGMCSYNPAQPAPTYFTLGNAIAALGFTLTVQQLLKPIYLFRLRATGLKLGYLLALVFAGAGCSIVATILPNVAIEYDGPFKYPIVWELLGGILVAVAYAIAALVSLRPARIYSSNILLFVRAAADLLSAANDDDRVQFANDILDIRNMERLIVYASALQRAESHGAHVEFERLRAMNAPLSISGPPPVSAFYIFAHRRELQIASYVSSLLNILSDPEFCSALVRKCSWLTADTLESMAAQRIYIGQAKNFVQEIARQAIINDESMVAKEIGYTGFGAVPRLSKSLFEDWFIIRNYDPLGGFRFGYTDRPSASFIERLNAASLMMLETAVKKGDYWPQGYIYSIRSSYEGLIRKAGFDRFGHSVEHMSAFHFGLQRLLMTTRNGLKNTRPDRLKQLYAAELDKYQTNLVYDLASLAFESIAAISNQFSGPDDMAWTHAVTLFSDIYPFHESETAGMDPLQQQLAIQIVECLRRNMKGWYPSISRVLLAVLGPYAEKPVPTDRTARVILKDAVYLELQKFSKLHSGKPESIGDFLPLNVRYDPDENSLTHTYRGGAQSVTKLSELVIPNVDLFDSTNWQVAISRGPA